MIDKRRKSLVDLRNYPAAIDLARKLYRTNSKLRQNHECREIAELLGMSHIAIWHAYQRGDLGVPAPNPERAEAWALGAAYYIAADRPCRRCGGTHRKPGDDVCYDCEEAYRDRTRKSKML